MSGDAGASEPFTTYLWYEDGLAEMAAGCIFMLKGLVLFGEMFASRELLFSRILGLDTLAWLTIGILFATMMARRIVRSVRNREAHSNSRHVSYQRSGRYQRIFTGVVAGVIGSLAAILLRFAPDLQDWIPGLQGIGVGVFLLILAHNARLFRFYGLALFSSFAGVIIGLPKLGGLPGSAIYFCVTGIALTVSGGITFWIWLAQTEPAGED